jgi:type IV secretion system protein VirB4
LRYNNAKVFCFDKGYSAFILAKACGGDHYDILAENSDLNFCPLANIHLEHERIWASDWIESLVELQHVRVTPNHRQKIHQALNLLSLSDFRTMSDFVNTLQDLELREALAPYSLAGSMGRLLDAKSDSLEIEKQINTQKKKEKIKNTFEVFEMEHLMALGEKNIVPILQILFHKIDNQLDGSPTLIIVDESWLFISHPIFREKIRNWLKVLRKNNTAVVFATQSISDITNSPIRDVIYESCPTKIFLPNLEAGNEICKNEYLKIGLNESQIDIIRNAIGKKQYYYSSPLGKRLFELNLGNVAMSFVGASGKEDLKQVRALMANNPESWQTDWLKDKAGEEWALAWSKNTNRE